MADQLNAFIPPSVLIYWSEAGGTWVAAAIEPVLLRPEQGGTRANGFEPTDALQGLLGQRWALPREKFELATFSLSKAQVAGRDQARA